MGTLHGLFVAEIEKVNALIASEKDVHFGEVLGKHSEITGPIEKGEATLLTDDPEKIAIVESIGCCFGFDPFDYIETEEE